MTVADVERLGLRERRKLATRDALRAAAVRLALEHGPEKVRVEEIAAAGVSPRTYNNYFSSREEAILCGVAAERAERIGAALRDRPPGEPLAEAVVNAMVANYCVEEPRQRSLCLLAAAVSAHSTRTRADTSPSNPGEPEC